MNIFSVPIYAKGRFLKSTVDRDSILLISHKLTGTWQITNLSDGTTHTPQSFEAEHGFLPPCPPSATAKTRKEWTAHQKKNPDERGSSRGFG